MLSWRKGKVVRRDEGGGFVSGRRKGVEIRRKNKYLKEPTFFFGGVGRGGRKADRCHPWMATDEERWESYGRDT